MRKLYVLIFVVIAINSVTTQTLTFKRDIGHKCKSIQVLEKEDCFFIAKDSSYINYPDNIKILRIEKRDVYGSRIWGKKFSLKLSTENFSPLEIDNTHIYSLFNGADNLDSNYLSISKFDFGGNEIFSEKALFERGKQIKDVISVDDSSLIGIAINNDGFISLIKISKINGDILWQKDFQIPANIASNDNQLYKNRNNNLLVLSKHEILEINSDGTLLNSYSFDFEILEFGYKEDILNFISRDSLYSLNLTTNKLNSVEKNLSYTSSISISENKDLYVFSSRKLMKFNQGLDLQWEKNFESSSTLFRLYIGNNDKIIFYGKEFILTDNNLKYLSIDKKSNSYFRYNQYYLANSSVDFNIISYGIDYCDFSYSSDNGNTWKSISNYLPADNHTFSCLIPDYGGKNILIKVESSDGQEYKLMSTKDIEILQFQPYEYIETDNILMWQFANGTGSRAPSDWNGLYWGMDNEDKQSAVFTDGLVWSGKVGNTIIANGSAERSGLTPGFIDEAGNPSDPIGEKSKIFKLKRNWEYLDPGPERNKLLYDYLNWPGNLGAPYLDIDGNGEFDRESDKPDYIGSEVLFYTANDLKSKVGLYGCSPHNLGIETKCIIWAENDNELLKNVIFKKYIISNKGENTIEDFALSYYSDFDLGYQVGNYVGCDSTLNLGFGYVGEDIEATDQLPPAIGYLLLQGPVVEGSLTDSAFYDNNWINGYKNLKMTSFTPIFKGAFSITTDAMSEEEWFNNCNVLNTKDGTPQINPLGNETKYGLSGDPVAGSGWYEGDGWPNGLTPYIRRLMVNSGNIDLNPGDEQEFVIAILLARGSDRLNNITKLKEMVPTVRNYYYNGTTTSVNENYVTVNKFNLYQNYPNPFNPATTIKYTVGQINNLSYDNQKNNLSNSKQHVTLKVYNTLGQEVATLVNKQQSPGDYEVQLDGSKLASGVYFYKISVGNFVVTKKMLLLK